MTFKKKIAAVLAALSAVSVIGVTASATSTITSYSYTLNPKVGSTVMTGAEKKEDNVAATAVTYSGLNNCYVTFRVRNSTGTSYASNYVDVSKINETFVMTYLPGQGHAGEYYRLASSMDAGQAKTTTTVTGVWIP